MISRSVPGTMSVRSAVSSREADAAVSPDDVDLAIVVEQHRQIVQRAFHRAVLPRTGRILRREQLRLLAVHVAEDIEGAVAVTERGRPQPLAIDVLAVFEAKCRAEIELRRRVREEFPVDQVARVQDRQAGHRVHGRAGEIEILADADHVRIGEFLVEKRIGERAVAIVGCPGRRLRVRAESRLQQDGQNPRK